MNFPSAPSVLKKKNLFTNSDIEHMLGCENVNELCRYLSDKGYGEGDDIEDILKSHSENVWEYLKRTAPDFAIFKPFFYLNDLHNLKAVLKGTLSKQTVFTAFGKAVYFL